MPPASSPGQGHDDDASDELPRDGPMTATPAPLSKVPQEGPRTASQAASAPAPTAETGRTGFAAFLQLERRARHADGADALAFIIVNETRRLIQYDQAVFLQARADGRLRVAAISGIPAVDRTAPLVQWLERIGRHLVRTGTARTAQPLTAEGLPDRLARDWTAWSPPQVCWVPLISPNQTLVGGLWLARRTPWTTNEQVLADQLCDAYAHARAALDGGGYRPRRTTSWLHRLAVLILLAGGIAALQLPVPQSTLAPAEVVPRDPFVVAAPLDGIIATFAIAPNETVAAGQTLLTFEDTELRSRLRVAERALGVAVAEYQAARQGAFADRRSKAQLAALEAQVALREAERVYAARRLERVTVTAPRAGVAVFTDPQDWIGRPVRTGERILTIADPSAVELHAYVPVKEVIDFEPGATIRLFLDIAPLAALPATLLRASYEAEDRPSGDLAYRVIGRFDLEQGRDGSVQAPPPRLGLKGTARIEGRPVPLYLYLFRRPIAVLRQTLGF